MISRNFIKKKLAFCQEKWYSKGIKMKKDLRTVMKMNKILDYKNRVLARLKARKEHRKVKVLRRNNQMKTYLKIAVLATLGLGNPVKVASSATNSFSTSKVQTPLDKTKQELEKAKKSILDNGRIFINPKNEELIYLTHEQCKEQKIGAESSIFDVCTARENTLYADSSDEDRYRAYTNTEGLFYGPFQYSDVYLKNAVLWALCQENDPELQNFARKMMPKSIHEDEPTLTAFRKSYKKAQEKMKTGAVSTTTLNNVFGYQEPIRNNLLKTMGLYEPTGKSLDKIFSNAVNQTDFSVIKRFFDESCLQVYIPINLSKEKLAKIPHDAIAEYLMGQIHRNSKENFNLAAQNQADSLITIHGTLKIPDGRINKSGIKRMRKARRDTYKEVQINGKRLKKLLDLSYYKGYTKLCHTNQYKDLLQKEDELVTNLAQKQIEEKNKSNTIDFCFAYVHYMKDLLNQAKVNRPSPLLAQAQANRANNRNS